MRRTRTTKRVVLCLGFSWLLGGCMDRSPTDAPVEPTLSDRSNATLASGTAIDSIGQTIAIILSNRVAREGILSDLYTSPFPEQSIHLQAYLAGPRGIELLSASLDSVEVPALLGTLESLPPLQIWIPAAPQRRRTVDRFSVFATTSSVSDLLALPEYRVWTRNGRAVRMRTHGALKETVFVIAPLQWDFGINPEHARTGASPVQGTASLTECDPETVIIECDDDGDGGGGGGGGTPEQGLVIGPGRTWSDCTGAGIVSNDYDTIDDQCEWELADAFAPHLMFSDDDFDHTREPHWIVKQWQGSEIVQIMYALAYHRDSGHDGDSEFIELRVSHNGGKWYLDKALLSAHWLAVWPFDATAWYGYSQLEWGSVYRGAPRIYPSSGKHANYESKSHCNGRVFEHCTSQTHEQRVGITPGGNLGSWFYVNLGFGPMPVGYFKNCVDSAYPTTYPGHECFWESVSPLLGFGGWLYGDSSSYQSIFEWYGWRLSAP